MSEPLIIPSHKEIISYYSNTDILKEMLNIAQGREVACATADGRYFKRPDMIVYPRDIIERVKNGAVSFHCSVESWSSPMAITTAMKNIDELRIAWDFIIDIDSKVRFEHAKIAARMVYEFLNDFYVKPTIKFSGRRGFHIAIASNAFPQKVNMKSINVQYPELARLLSNFVAENIKARLMEELAHYEGGYGALTSLLPSIKELSPFEFVDIERNWGVRHLFRMPYSFNEKSWYISVPIDASRIETFDIKDACHKNVKIGAAFMRNADDEAIELLDAALSWAAKIGYGASERTEAIKTARAFTKKIPEEFFAPCIRQILNGLAEGRKRSVFTLISFLRNMNWTPEEIEAKIREWNARNRPALPEQYIRTQLKWHLRQARLLMPANCRSELYYGSIGICNREEGCKNNPVNYALSKYKKHLNSKEEISKAKKAGRKRTTH